VKEFAQNSASGGQKTPAFFLARGIPKDASKYGKGKRIRRSPLKCWCIHDDFIAFINVNDRMYED
jgi:hypothetical protein